MRPGIAVKVAMNAKKVNEAVDRAAFKNTQHALATIRQYAQASMKVGKGPSAPGTPPNVHRGRLWRSIAFAYDKTKQEGIVGPRYNKGSRSYSPLVGHIHEFGGTYGGQDIETRKRMKKSTKRVRKARTFPARPFMSPALDRASARMAGDWKSSITN
jgi:phage gpG-like protein